MDETQGLSYPNFSKIQIDAVAETLKSLIDEHKKSFYAQLNQANFTWENLLLPLQEQDEPLEDYWSLISHLHQVANSDALREVYQDGIQTLSAYHSKLAQDPDYYRAVKSLSASPYYDRLSSVQQKVIQDMLRGFRLSGVTLPETQQAECRELVSKLAALSAHFEDNVLDATQGWCYSTEDAQQLSGIPESTCVFARAMAEENQQSGWRFTLDFPVYYAVLSYADDRIFRREMYEAYVSRASDCGPDANRWDNAPIMVEILDKKQQLAALLGFEDYVALSLESKMADSAQVVRQLLDQLVERVRNKAQQELFDLQQFAEQQGHLSALEPWDIAYFSEKMRQHLFDVDSEALRAYFPLEKVLQGLFSLVNTLFGLQVKAVMQQDVWDDQVRVFQILDQHGVVRGLCYMDLFARPNKRGGAWMANHQTRFMRMNGEVQIPSAFVVCNFQVPVGDRGAYLNHEEILTLFHEFGHCLHHLLSQVDYTAVSGMQGVFWDAVELPSQLMENWAWQYPVLRDMSEHIEDQALFPSELFDKLNRARHFQSGLSLLRQCEFSLFDLDIHAQRGLSAEGIQAILDGIRQRVGVVPVWPQNRFQNSFIHIFSGGYDAGYYSYIWAEVLSSDVFARFEEEGLFDQDVGQALLRSIFETGGSRPMLENFMEFRGRKPDIAALLRHRDIDFRTEVA